MDTSESGRKIEPFYLQKAITYEAYVTFIDELVTAGRTTGPDQSKAFLHYTVLNQQRMHRIGKLIVLEPAAAAMIQSILLPQTWLVLTEAWCGDAAQSLPVMHALAMLNPVISLRLLMRDDNPELMDLYLTKGVSRSIPKLIGIDTLTREELFIWGPRPTVLQESFYRMKGEGMEYHAIKEEVQRWYNKDKTASIQIELATLASAGSEVGMTG
jgi:thioredoxin family protein